MILPVAGSDKIQEVDLRIFTYRYYRNCMACTFCSDACCNHGVDLGTAERDKILAEAPSLSKRIPFPPSAWFQPEEELDEDMPGGKLTHTRVVQGRCVFRNREGRGCLLHTWALEQGRDYHELKPMICNLFPVTLDGNRLTYADDVEDDLVCAGTGDSLYQGAREEIAYYFGEALVEALDRLETRVLSRERVLSSKTRT